ncbi:hypothetical protein [Acinetobacter gyllenbergii]|uniref:hypothetical protein n=1 Tax=Acinetobacter gyllenbergii TaxID=134534 RepID=UPI003AF9456E
MLNIEKEREAFEALQNPIVFERIAYIEEANLYTMKNEFRNDLFTMTKCNELNFGWKMYQESAKRANEKLEGCVVVPVEMPDSFDDALYMYSNDISVVNSESDGFIPIADLDHGKVWKLMVEASRGGNE